jgi:hypothetical protein
VLAPLLLLEQAASATTQAAVAIATAAAPDRGLVRLIEVLPIDHAPS